MTSQVAVMNMFGVAVASDTVRTVSRGGESKVVPNASKIIELGHDHKVLVLSSGDVLLNDFPHELHLTEWAKTLPGPLPRLEDYVRSYKSWSAREQRLASPQSQFNELVEKLDEEIGVLESRLSGSRLDLLSRDSRAVHRLDRMMLVKELKNMGGDSDFDELDRDALSLQLESEEVNLAGRLKRAFSHLTPLVTQKNLSLCYELVLEAVGKYAYRAKESTIGFIGMGSDEPFASLWKLECSAVMTGGLLSRDSRDSIEPPDKTARIHWFAQADRIEAFLRGFHPFLLEMAADHLHSLLETKFGSEFWDAFIHRADFVQMLEEESKRLFISPLFSTLRAFSTTELASFADSLLASQLVSSVFLDGLSTAGGVVEVATIDAKNGVIWHRRLPKSRLSLSNSIGS